VLKITTKIGMHELFTHKSEDGLSFLYSEFYPRSYNLCDPIELLLFKKDFNTFHNDLNLWIVKPYNQSKGIGIQVFNNLDLLLDNTLHMNNNLKYIVQKYLENPHLLHFKK
jgi:glutathionylspermidine synthase